MKAISVTKAEYVDGLRLKIVFDDNTSHVVDFETFFDRHPHPQYNKYKNEVLFRRFKLVMGNIIWGKDWDLVFLIYDLYKGKI